MPKPTNADEYPDFELSDEELASLRRNLAEHLGRNPGLFGVLFNLREHWFAIREDGSFRVTSRGECGWSQR